MGMMAVVNSILDCVLLCCPSTHQVRNGVGWGWWVVVVNSILGCVALLSPINQVRNRVGVGVGVGAGVLGGRSQLYPGLCFALLSLYKPDQEL